MTIEALRTIQNQEQPEVRHRPAPRLPHQPAEEAPAMPTTSTPPSGASSSGTEQLPVGRLLAWAEQHADLDVQDQGARARAALAALRQRHAADTELSAITSEAEQLEQRLAALRAREAELTPAKPKAKRRAATYSAAAVRAWAKENDIDVPERGRVPGAVADAWRKATGTAESEAR